MTCLSISFYQYTNIPNPQQLVDTIRSRCQELNILGRILIAKEGINGACCGTIQNIGKLQNHLKEPFPMLTFREQHYKHQTYHKLVVKVRQEICVFGTDVDLNHTGTHVSPQELQNMYENNDHFLIIDARNDYEYNVGHFSDAIPLPIKRFRELPKAIDQLAPKYKEKKVVMFCTGGIRCEKATAYMKEIGFKDVSQVNGGIINYVNTITTNSHWQGGLFVFDDRLVSDVGKNITTCTHCKRQEKQIYNCHNLDCDKLFVCCLNCANTTNHTCCSSCQLSPRQRKKKLLVIGKVKNFYAQPRIALVNFSAPVELGMEIIFKGKTTNISQKITHLVDEKKVIKRGKGALTLPVIKKVRKNDQVLLQIPFQQT